MKKSGIITIIAVLLISQGILGACKKAETPATAPEAHQQEMMNKSFELSKKAVAARVNGEDITMFALLREMNTIAPQYLGKGGQRTPELDKKIRKDALDNVVALTLAVQEAKKSGMRVAPATIDAELAKMKASAGSEDAFKKYLVDNGFTENEYRATIERDALFEMIAAKEIDAKIKVSDAAVRARYEKEKAGLKDSPHGQMTFEQAKGMIEQKLRAEAAEKRMRQWEKELKKNARIEIMEQNNPAAEAR